jgi:hypothetical protein
MAKEITNNTNSSTKFNSKLKQSTYHQDTPKGPGLVSKRRSDKTPREVGTQLSTTPDKSQQAINKKIDSLKFKVYGNYPDQTSVEFSLAFRALVQSNPTEKQLNLYSNGLEATIRLGLNPTSYTNAFPALVQNNSTDEELESKLKLYIKGIENYKKFSNQSYYEDACIALVQNNSTGKQLESRLNLYFRKLNSAKKAVLFPEIAYRNVFVALVQTNCTDKELESRLDIYIKALNLWRLNSEDNGYYTGAFVDLIKTKPTDEQMKIYFQGLDYFEKNKDSMTGYTIAYKNLVQNKPTDKKLGIYLRNINLCKRWQYSLAHFTKVFAALVQTKTRDKELEDRLDLYFKGLDLCKKLKKYTPYYIYDFTDYRDAFINLVKIKPTKNQLNIYDKGLEALRNTEFYMDIYIKAFIDLVQAQPTENQLDFRLGLYINGLKALQNIDKLMVDSYTNEFIALANTSSSKKELKSKFDDMLKKLSP